jgi:hypothetical protein
MASAMPAPYSGEYRLLLVGSLTLAVGAVLVLLYGF